MKGFGALVSCDCPKAPNADDMFFPKLALAEAPTRVTDSAVIDSAAIDNALLVRVVEAQNTRIARARWSLQQGLKVPGTRAAQMHFEQALRELGTLGAG